MNPRETLTSVQKLNILSPKHLADILKIPPALLEKAAETARVSYNPYLAPKPSRPFQKNYTPKLRPIDNPLQELKWIQKRIYRRLLKPICFPDNVFGAVPKRDVMDNAELHLGSSPLVTLDVKQCFPSITNLQIYQVWSNFLGCSPPVAKLLTGLTSFRRHLPQGAATSPLLANLYMWMIDEPIRLLCIQLGVIYSTWIDDLAFSGELARDLIQPTISLLAANGLRINRKKIKIMGSNSPKLLTGTRLGATGTRAPKDKISRLRSGIHKLRMGLIPPEEVDHYTLGLIGQLRFVYLLCPKDALQYMSELKEVTRGRWLDTSSKKFLASAV